MERGYRRRLVADLGNEGLAKHAISPVSGHGQFKFELLRSALPDRPEHTSLIDRSRMINASLASSVLSTNLLKRFMKNQVIKAQRAIEMVASVLFLSPPVQRLSAWRLQRLVAPDGIRAAVVAHLYYPEFLAEVLAAQAALPPGSPLLITAPPAQAEHLRRATRGLVDVEIYEVDNRGRDMAPFLKLLTEGRLDRFDAVLKIHGKKSPHLRNGNLRRRVFLAGLAGSRGNVSRILLHFRDRAVGLVGLAAYFRTRSLYWMGNRAMVEALCGRMGAAARVGFFEGSMFWVRPAALEPLRQLRLQTEDFAAEAGQLDGTLHHAVERCFILSALVVGYETRSVAGWRLDPH
jgi:lipopolysaccharide biosynthesis protein